MDPLPAMATRDGGVPDPRSPLTLTTLPRGRSTFETNVTVRVFRHVPIAVLSAMIPSWKPGAATVMGHWSPVERVTEPGVESWHGAAASSERQGVFSPVMDKPT